MTIIPSTLWGILEDDMEDKREKRYVPVVVRFDTSGKMRPLVIEFDEGHKYEVDPVSGSAAWGTGTPAGSTGRRRIFG